VNHARHVLIAGVSARAAAESAALARFAVTAVDAFGDLDHHPAVRVAPPVAADGRFTAGAAARAALAIPSDAVAYLSPFENHPRAVAALARGRTLWGNPPDVLRRVRDPVLVAEALRRRGLPAPVASRTAPGDSHQRGAPRDWLIKPLASGGGHGVREWRRGSRVPRRGYVQERIDGVPGSVVFVAALGRAVVLGVSRQLVGEAAFGAAGYRYCGSILSTAGSPASGRSNDPGDHPAALAGALAEAFGLVGVNGVDVVTRDGVPMPIEVNPRWCASMELVERAYGVSVFGVHVEACAAGRLPALERPRGMPAAGKAIVFARQACVAQDTRGWLVDGTVRDVPRPRTHIAAGQPVCTVLAEGPSDEACHAALVRRAERVYAELGTMT
jgi:predicted ATP-grasp superfamily ATP-dependent carboligase